MSRNFELLQQAEKEELLNTGRRATASPTARAVLHSGRGTCK